MFGYLKLFLILSSVLESCFCKIRMERGFFFFFFQHFEKDHSIVISSLLLGEINIICFPVCAMPLFSG
jgi:hypothetical protein